MIVVLLEFSYKKMDTSSDGYSVAELAQLIENLRHADAEVCNNFKIFYVPVALRLSSPRYDFNQSKRFV